MTTLAVAKLQAYRAGAGARAGADEPGSGAAEVAVGQAEFAEHCIAVLAEIAAIQTGVPTTMDQAVGIAATLELLQSVATDGLGVPANDEVQIATLLAWGGIRLCAAFTDPARCVVPVPLDGAFRRACRVLAASAEAIKTLQ
jgi:hypothetical protein